MMLLQTLIISLQTKYLYTMFVIQLLCVQLFHVLIGMCSDDDFTSSNDSRESSSSRRPPRPPSDKCRKQRTSHISDQDELSLDISVSGNSRYRDSDISSGDPSPNLSACGMSPDDPLARRHRLGINRSSSSSSIDALLRKPRSGE